MLRVHMPDNPEFERSQIESARAVLLQESQALTTVAERLGPEFASAVVLLDSCTNNVIVAGIGKAGYVAEKVAATFSSTGTRAFFLHPSEAIHGDLGRVQPGDVVLALSHSGETGEMVEILPPIRRSGASLIGITAKKTSSLARASDVAIAYGPISEACPIGLAPSTSCTIMMAIGDALAFSLMRLSGFNNHDFGRYHPGGSLGRQLKRVDEIMRVGDQLRIARSNLTIREAFVRVQKPGRRTGAIVLVDEAGRLEGIFTDSDLARLVEQREFSGFERPISEYMTRRPTTLARHQLVLDAMALLRDRRISEIPVLDEDGRPVGIVDITDVIDLLPEAA